MSAVAERVDARRRADATPGLHRQLIFISLLALGVSIIWLSPRPPMVDLPQHAGQVAFLRDLILGQSPWRDELRINVLTPYLIGYGLALPLSFVLPVATAVKLILTGAYLAFTWGCLAIARDLKVPRQLDPYYVIGFFGFAYAWGFYTFLVAAPICLWFIKLNIHYAREPTRNRGLAVLCLGLVLLLSHGLLFLFGAVVGGLFLFVRYKGLRRFALAAIPFAFLAVALGCIFHFTRQNLAEQAATTSLIHMGPLSQRPAAAALFPFFSQSMLLDWISFVGLAALPIIMGLRVDWARREALVIFGVLAAIFMFVPSAALSTSLLYERFAVLLLPAYAWVLKWGPERPTARAVGSAAILVISAAQLTIHGVGAFQFGREEREFERILARTEPQQRALSLIYDTSSAALVHPNVYLHHPGWYQADKQGFVDFNFAWFHPQIARLRHANEYRFTDSFAWAPETFDWKRHDGERYRYFIMRGAPPERTDPFANALCRPSLVASRGKWSLYEACA